MSIYNSINDATKNTKITHNTTNGVIYSIPHKIVNKSQSKNVVDHPSTPTKQQQQHQQDHYAQAHSFATSSRGSSNIEFQVQNYYRSTTINSHEPPRPGSAVLPKNTDSFFDMLQDYQPAVLGVIGTNQRSPGPSEFLQHKDIQYSTLPSTKDSHSNTNHPHPHQTDSNSSSSTSNIKINRDLKVKNKIHRFLVQPKAKSKTDDDKGLLGLSVLTKTCSINDQENVTKQSSHSVATSTSVKRTLLPTEDIQDHHQERQRAFGHYDCQSLAANMSYVKTKRKLSTNSSTGVPELKNSTTHDFTYGNDRNEGNELLESCPLFCNEIGGENDGRFSSRTTPSNTKDHLHTNFRSTTPCCRVSILESLPNETLWRVGICPFQNGSCPIESVDHGAHYYKRYFLNQRHENWFGIDENLGPIAISIKKDKINDSSGNLFRVIIRNSELQTLRGSVIIEDSIGNNSRVSEKSVTSKELLEYIAPDIQLNCLRLGVSTSLNTAEQQLLKLDEQGLQSKYKVGILYCRSGQSSEEDMYNNEYAGPAFTEFLEIIGKRVRLKGFQQYKAGLDNKSDSTGTHSVYAFYKNCEIMFHVCTMLPFTPNNRQQLLRKRHIGNDIVTIIFQEPGALSFDPNNIRSQFQHVFLIVRAVNPCSSNTTYRVAITRSKEVPVFGPPLTASALFSRNKLFAEFILAKTINAENAAHRSDKFANLAIRTRREYLKDLCINYSSNTALDPANKFSIFSNRKKDNKLKIRFSTDLYKLQRGAICWRVLLPDQCSSSSDITTIECCLGISMETFIIMEELSKSVIFAMPTRSILGWTNCGNNSFRIFYHNGECISFFVGGGTDEQQQVVERLEAVTLGNGALKLNMRRYMMGQLGFHVQPDGIVTQVDATGQAWAAGMRRGYRLVEVCNKMVVATLSYAELIDLLKTSAQINAIVIKSISEGIPRQGCFNKNCKVNLLSRQKFAQSPSSNKYLLNLDKDAYHVKNLMRKETTDQQSQQQHSLLNFKSSGNSGSSGAYGQRSLEHYKSKTCSGYNTGSSCFSSNSLGHEYKKEPVQQQQRPSSSSPLLHKNDKWYVISNVPNSKTQNK